MAVGLAAATANSMLDALCRNVSYTNAAVHVQLHVGDPGSAGTSNQANETSRKQVTFGTGAAAGTISNTAAITWTNITVSAGTQDATHFSAWTASTAGTFLFSGTVTANPYSSGDTFTIAIGDLDVSLTNIAA
jgi:hypothetical protein